MTNVLQQLESKEAVLLMYLADELPATDRAEIERRLATDPAMAADLERLRAAQAAFARAMPALDRSTRLPSPPDVAVRRVVRAMRQWHARRAAQPAAAPARPPLRFPWWSYPLAAAASVVIAFVVWWGNSERSPRADWSARRAVGYDAFVHPAPPDFDVVAAWEMGGLPDDLDDPGALAESSDYDIFFLLDDADVGRSAPGADPADRDAEDDDTYL